MMMVWPSPKLRYFSSFSAIQVKRFQKKSHMPNLPPPQLVDPAWTWGHYGFMSSKGWDSPRY